MNALHIALKHIYETQYGGDWDALITDTGNHHLNFIRDCGHEVFLKLVEDCKTNTFLPPE